MRRVLGLIFVALVLLGSVAALGAWALARIGPENVRRGAEERLAGLLGTDVELGPVELRLSRAGLVVAADGLRAWPTPGGPVLSAERVEIQLDLWGLLAGELELRSLALEGPELRFRREGDGLALDLPPGTASPLASRPHAPGEEPARPALDRLLDRVPQIELRRGRARVVAGGAGVPEIALEELDGWIARRWLRGGAAVELSGALRSAGEAAGRFELEGSVTDADGLAGTARVDELALRPLATLAPARVRERVPGGRASGRIELRGGGSAPLRLRFDLDAPRLRLTRGDAPVELHAVRIDGTATGSKVRGGATRWAVAARASAAGLQTPLEATALASASGGLRVEQVALGAPLELAKLAPLLEALPEPARSRGRELVRHLRAGRLLDAKLGFGPSREGGAIQASGRVDGVVLEVGGGRVDGVAGAYALEGGVLTLSGVSAQLGGEAAALAALWPEAQRERVREVLQHIGGGRLSEVELRWPLGQAAPLQGLALRGRLDDGQALVGARSRVDALSGTFAYDRGTLALGAVAGRLDGQPLPTLDATVAGVEHLGDGLRCVAPEPVPPLPGRAPLAEWVRGPADQPPGAPSWQRVRVEADWLAHPALGCVVDELVGSVEPLAGGGLRLGVERALWAGLSVEGRLEHRPAPPESVRLDVRLGVPRTGARTRAPTGIWARGRFSLESQRLGSWDARGARGRFRLEGETLFLEDGTLRLTPGPRIAVSAVEVDLSQADRVPFHANGEVTEGEFGDLLLAITDTTEPAVSGPFVGAISLRGSLRPGHPTLGDADGGFSLHVRDGVIRQRFRLFLAVAMASETLNPFRERGTIRFGAMDVEGTLQSGTWVVDTAQIDGPALRALVHGRVGAVAPNPVEGVMALFFFRSVDRAIGWLPLVNRALLGRDKNLLGAYFALSGPWSGINASVLPVKSLASGPASVVLEGVPMALQQGVRVLEKMIEVAPLPEAPAEPSPPSAPQLPLGSRTREKADS